MKWSVIIALAIASYAFKAIGLVLIGGRQPRGPAADAMRMLPAALLSALVVVGTMTVDRGISIDARLVGMAFAALGVWRRWSFTVVVVGAALVTALVRLWG